jgi:xanthine dehydrogenase accessory factor
MTDLVHLLPLWNALRATRTEYVLATVVEVEGSGYRKPGARMIIAADGRRSGTISAGCLEAEVARKAFWHTENGPVLRRYSTSSEDGEVPFGMGCGGVIHLLLERSATADVLLERLAADFAQRRPLGTATALDGGWIGQRAFWPDGRGAKTDPAIAGQLNDVANQCFNGQHSFSQTIEVEDRQVTTVRGEWIAPRPGLFVFGAGDDAIPLVQQARQLGWYVTLSDGRAHLVTRSRFPHADDLHPLPPDIFPAFQFRPTDAAVIMTHSLQQDTRILGHLLKEKLAYVGVLGPRRRTKDMLLTLASETGLPPSEQTFKIDEQVERWMDRLHAPMGLDLGGDTPADIALAVIAEIQQNQHRATGLSLRQLRARGVASQPMQS